MSYLLVPAAFDPDADKNGNSFICLKGPQGRNGHFNTTDDKVD